MAVIPSTAPLQQRPVFLQPACSTSYVPTERPRGTTLHGRWPSLQLTSSGYWYQRTPCKRRLSRLRSKAMPWHDLGTLAFAPGLCFDQACQAAQDRAFLIATGLPLLGLLGAIIYSLRPAPTQADDQIFEDPITGSVFESVDGAQPERDKKGELAFRVVSYTPWPVDEGTEGERIRIDVGPINSRQPRTFVFPKTLPGPSRVLAVRLPRPLGVVLEEDPRRKRVLVGGFVEGSNAAQRVQVAKMDPAAWERSPREGDILRACTATNFVFGSGAVVGDLSGVRRTIVVFGADGQKWPKVVGALKKGDSSDGDVTLILERPMTGELN